MLTPDIWMDYPAEYININKKLQTKTTDKKPITKQSLQNTRLIVVVSIQPLTFKNAIVNQLDSFIIHFLILRRWIYGNSRKSRQSKVYF
jgi:hypothetical protein